MAADFTLGGRSKETRSVSVKSSEVVRWSLTVADSLDVSLSIAFIPEADPSSVLTLCPPIRITRDYGSYTTPGAGTVEFTLDNSFSLLRGKSGTFRTAVGAAAVPQLSAFLTKPAEAGNTSVSARLDTDALNEFMKAVIAAGVYDAETTNNLSLLGTELFFTNCFDAAERFFAPLAPQVPLFALAYGTMAFLRAVMTWEADVVRVATERLTAAQNLCLSIMPAEGMLTSLFRSTSSTSASEGRGDVGLVGGMTATQLEATVVYAESTLLNGLLQLMEESIMGMVRAALAIRSGWNYYVQCDKALGGQVSRITGGPSLGLPKNAPADALAEPVGSPTASTGSLSPPLVGDGNSSSSAPAGLALTHHVIGGVEFGMGAFNCVASVLPQIVMKIISVLGFPCDREAGMEQLRQCTRHFHVRTPLAGLFLLIMRVLLPSFHSGDISENVPEAEAVLASNLGRYGDSALFLWMAGRLARMQGNVALARERLLRCAAGPIEWVQLAHLCAYELGWCYAFLHDWDNVLPLFTRLREENEWSKAFYAYMQALAHLQLGRVAEARARMRDVLRLSSRRLGGKVISAEQYSVRRAAEFLALTTIDAKDAAAAGVPTAVDEADEASLLGPSYTQAKLRLPALVERGSRAHACVLAYGAPLAGLEKMYLFNGMCQMDDIALVSGIKQVDAVLAVMAEGFVFDAKAPAWQGTDAANKWGAAPAWQDAHREAQTDAAAASQECKTGEQLIELFNSAANVTVGSLGALPATAAPASSKGFSFRSMISAITPGTSGSSGSGSASQYATATPMLPIHTVAVGALIRGASCASLGRVDEAAACYRWVIGAGEAGQLKRDMHTYAYALYELAILYLDAYKAFQAGETFTPAPKHKHVHGGGAINIKHSELAKGETAKTLKRHAKTLFQRARDIRDDYNWKVRLHMRIHLALDEVAQKKKPVVGSLEVAAGSEDAILAAAADPIGSATGGDGRGGDDEDGDEDGGDAAGEETGGFDGEDVADAAALALGATTAK